MLLSRPPVFRVGEGGAATTGERHELKPVHRRLSRRRARQSGLSGPGRLWRRRRPRRPWQPPSRDCRSRHALLKTQSGSITADSACKAADGHHGYCPHGARPNARKVNRKRTNGRKKAKDNRAKGGENLYKESLENMMAVRRELASERREAKNKEIEERRQAEERKVAAEERRAAAEERRAAAEEKLAEIKERKVSNEEMLKRIEQEQKIMFMDASGLDEKGRAYYELCRDQILMSRGYGGGGGGYGGGGDGGGYGGGNDAV
ncbi:hypothetical protein ZWY2020_026265 [Hordeum vulgare]|nr:hypothetical protein ZWY2020_026265 [Hordeum vulgare]